MSADLPWLRSVLFAPGSDEEKLERTLRSEADAVVADLEDSVVQAEKAAARDIVQRAFGDPGDGCARLVRVNGAETPWFDDDVSLLARLDLDGVVLPKATPSGVAALASAGLPVIAIVETAAGVRFAYEIASSPNVLALLLGAVDLGAELGLEPDGDRLELLDYVRPKLVIDSAAAGIRPPFDAVHLEFRDDEGLAKQAERARRFGLRGKACIHPAQVPVVNRVFAPRPDEIEWARRVIEVAQAGEEAGRGAVALDGALVDTPVVARAQRIVDESGRA